MKKIMMVLAAVALLAAAGVSISAANAKPGGQELKLDGVVREVTPGPSASLPKAAMEYVEIDLFRDGDAGGAVIGEGDLMAMVTAPVGVSEVMGLHVLHIFGEGEIHVSLGPGIGRNPGGRVGAIIGGTDIYRGVTGEYHLQSVVGGEIHITFKFNPGRN